MVKKKDEEHALMLLLEEMESESKPTPKPKRSFTEVAPVLSATGLRRIYYKLDGAVHSSMIFQGIINGLPTNGSLLGWDERLIMLVDKVGQCPNALKWAQDLLPDKDLERQFEEERRKNPNSKKKKVLPRAVRVCDLRLLGPDEKRGHIVQAQDVAKISIPPSIKISRMMQVEQGLNATFEWVDVKKKKGDD